MSYYFVKCEACEYTNDDFEQPMSAPWPAKCPGCGRKKLIQDYSHPKDPICRTDDATTVGQVAERNAKRMGKELHQKRSEEILGPETMAKRKAPKPWWRSGDKPLDVSRSRT